jgi:sugar phosphate isomerase/epimerase
MVIALSTGSLYTYGISRVFALAAQAGFDGIEVLIDERWDTRQAEYLSQLSGDHDLPISSLHSPFAPYVPGWPGDPIERLKATVGLAHALGVETIVLHLPMRVGYVLARGFKRSLLLLTLPSPFGKLRRWMETEMAAFEAQNGVRLCIENMPAKNILKWRVNPCWWNNLNEWPQFPHLTLDTTHLGTWGLNPLEVYQQVKERVHHVHLANFNGKEHRRLEDGHLPLVSLLHALRDDGYAGVIVVELQPEALEAQDTQKVLGHLKRQCAFCRQHLRLPA